MSGSGRQDPLVSDVAKASVGIGGLALCITLVFLGMRAVMDVGGACADGGPYVSAQSCPDGSTPALLLGIFGLFLFGGIGAVYGSRLGGIWARHRCSRGPACFSRSAGTSSTTGCSTRPATRP